jgi:hypothetical protein
MDQGTLLCLKCRSEGHTVDDCTTTVWIGELEWMFSDLRRDFNMECATKSESENKICSRCQGLELLRLLESRPPWTQQAQFTTAYEKGHPSILSLGRAGSIKFQKECPVCCLLFAAAPSTFSLEQEVLIIPDWTACRVSGELPYDSDLPEKRNYATCLLVVLKPSTLPVPFSARAHRGEALCLLESDLDADRTLGGRRIKPQIIDFSMILKWISSCEQRHSETCRPVPTDELKEIRLIDVDARKVVEYQGPQCDFVALSYVWGPIEPESYKLHDTVRALPKTLEDTLVFTKQLGKRYIWIDSVCIDQSDDRDKVNQINRMWSIYRGAWVTLIAASGDSAEMGLPRMSHNKTFAQVQCTIKGKTIVGLMPTLSQQNWLCPWSQRAWTLQEGLLTPRCLYISDHQIYYDCAATQCCESLDETKSWGHNLSVASTPAGEQFLPWMERQMGSGGLRIRLDEPAKRLEQMGFNLNLYSLRTMTFDTDALRAFEGILQKFNNMYPQGYFWGSAVEDFDWGLLWRSKVPPKRRPGFPSWSYTGWKGPKYYGQPFDVQKTRWIPTDLTIEACERGRLEQILSVISDVNRSSSSSSISITIQNDPVDKVMRATCADPEFDLTQHPTAEKEGRLFITAACLRWAPDFTRPTRHEQMPGEFEIFATKVKGVQCLIMITCYDQYVPGRWDSDEWVLEPSSQETWTCMLIARDHLEGYLVHQLLVLDIDEGGSVAERKTVMALLVPLGRLDVLEELSIRKRRIVLK